jgi:DNA-binding MarR family transcriptional regulator
MRYDNDPAPPDYQALADFRFHIRRFLKISEEAVETAGLEAQQYQLLLSLKAQTLQHGDVSVGDLAERLLLKHHSAVGLVDRLEHKGLVLRHRDPADQRRVLLQLTPSGEQTLSQLAGRHQAELRHLAPELIDALRGVLGHSGALQEAAH